METALTIILNFIILLKIYAPEIKQAGKDLRRWYYSRRRRP